MFFQIVFASLLQMLDWASTLFRWFSALRDHTAIVWLLCRISGYCPGDPGTVRWGLPGDHQQLGIWLRRRRGLRPGAYLFYYAAVVILAATVGFEIGVGFMSGLGVTSGFLHFIVGLIVAAILCCGHLPRSPKVVHHRAECARRGWHDPDGHTACAGSCLAGRDLNLGLVGDIYPRFVALDVSLSWRLRGGIAVQMLLPEDYAVEPNRPERMSLHHPLPTMPPRGAEPVM